MSFTVEKISFPCNGLKCSGLLYFPSDNNHSLPGLVMGFGFGITKEVHAEELGPLFAEKGIAVLAFDYRRFGESEGTPRQGLYPLDQVEDYRCAVNYLKTRPEISSNSICIWGSSFSGGHVLLQLAFPQPGVKCGIVQAPNVYSYKTAISYAGSLEPYMELIEAFRDSSCKGQEAYINIVSKDGPSILRTEESYKFYMEKAAMYDSFKNYIIVDSLEKILLYNPGNYAELVNKPVLFVLAKDDTTTPIDLALEVYQRIPGPKELVKFDGGHFDLYEEPLLSKVVEIEAGFIKKYTG